MSRHIQFPYWKLWAQTREDQSPMALLGPTVDVGDPSVDRIALPDVNSHVNSHAVQAWHRVQISGMVGARLRAMWKDQEWGNQKGAIQCRVATSDGKSLHNWRRIGTYPAPHNDTEVDVAIPEDFFTGSLCVVLNCSETDAGQIVIPGEDPASAVASATYGAGDTAKDVTDIVMAELKARRIVKATNDLFGDPCPGVPKTLQVTLTENAVVQSSGDMPDDAFLELGFEVGGGGGHALEIHDAFLYLEAIKKVFTAMVAGDEISISTISGEPLTTLTCPIPAEIDDAAADQFRSDTVRAAVQGVLGPNEGFKIVMSDTNQVIVG